MITSAGQAVQRMRFDAFQARQQSQFRYGQSEIAALAGEERFRDPDTGDLVSVPHDYPSDCIDGSGITREVLAGPDLRRVGQSEATIAR